MSDADAATQQSNCEKPCCTQPALKTYRDSKGNELRLCERHYYNLVSEENRLGGGGIGTDHPLIPGGGGGE